MHVTMMRRASLLIVAALLGASGCTDSGQVDTTTPPSGPSSPGPAEGAATSSPPWPIADARVDRVPDVLTRRGSNLPPAFPADNSVFPDLLADPPVRARMVYHPRESFDDRGDWETEQLFFLGVDDAWRSLDMRDLGLPETTHPGVDTYGAGALSPDGRTWVAPTEAGVVLLDLDTARFRVVDVPGDHTRYLGWHPNSRWIDVSRLHGRSTERTWSVDVDSLVVRRAPYLLPIDGVAHDGSVVTFSERGEETFRTVYRGRSQASDVVEVPYRHARRGGAVGQTRVLFGLNRDLLAVDSRSWAPVARLRLGGGDTAGWPRGWWGSDIIWFYTASRGLVTWNVVSGQMRLLTQVQPAARADTYWSASVAVDIMR